MANSSCGTEPDKKIPLNAAKQEVVSLPGKIQDDVESADVHGSSSDAAIIVHRPEVKLTNISTAETEEQDTDIKNKPQSQRDLDNPIINLCGNLDEVANETKSTPSPKPQTSQKDQKTPNPSQEPFLHLYSKDTLFQIDKSMDPEATDEPPERFPDTILELVEETCVSGEIQLQVTDEDETLEPPARKRLRKRMGMCGLGDKKKKLLFDKQHCRQGLLGINRRDKCNNAAQYLHKDDDMTLIDHKGTSGPACDENHEEVLVLEANSAAVMDDGRKEEVDREKRYALSKCSALVSVRVSTDESPKENLDVLKKATLDDNNGTIITGDETDEQVAGTVPEPPGSTIGKSLKMIQEEWSVAAASSDQDIETTICSEEPHFSGLEITNIEQDLEFSIKHEVLTDKQSNHANTIMDENRGKIATEVEVAQDVSCSPIRMTVEMSEGSVVATKEAIQAVHKKEIEDEHSPSLASSEKHDPNGPELCRPSKRESYPSYFNNTSILAGASIFKTRCGENKKSITAVLDSTAPAGEDAEDVKEISGPVAPPTGQENCIQYFIDQNACNTSVTPTVAEQQVCNSTLTPAASELPQETDVCVSPWLYSLTDSQIHKIALSMELEDQPVPESCDQPEDATELVRGLIRELSSLNRTVMVAQREMELVHRGKIQTAPKRLCGPRNTER